jgi:hypothetical protein
MFSVAPGVVLHLGLLLYPKDHPRRAEHIAELKVVPRWQRPFWVAETVVGVAFEAAPSRLRELMPMLRLAWRMGLQRSPMSGRGPFLISEEARMRIEYHGEDHPDIPGLINNYVVTIVRRFAPTELNEDGMRVITATHAQNAIDWIELLDSAP